MLPLGTYSKGALAMPNTLGKSSLSKYELDRLYSPELPQDELSTLLFEPTQLLSLGLNICNIIAQLVG